MCLKLYNFHVDYKTEEGSIVNRNDDSMHGMDIEKSKQYDNNDNNYIIQGGIPSTIKVNTQEFSEEKQKKPMSSRIVIAAIAIGLCIYIILLVNLIIPNTKYNKALDLLEEDKYSDAILQFSGLGDYKDSKAMVHECSYQEATDLLALENYDKASIKFKLLGDYKDSIAMIDECKYQKAINFMEMESFDEAIALYTELGEYSNCSNMVIDCKYKKAFSLLENDSYTKSQKLFKELNDYKDSASMVLEVMYIKGHDSMERREYDVAISVFKDLQKEDYKDSSHLIDKAYYDKGISSYDDGKLIEAYNAFSQIPKYLDSKHNLINLRLDIYNLAIDTYLNSKDYKYAEELFRIIGDYENSDKYLTLILASICNDKHKASEIEYLYDGDEIYLNLVKILDFENAKEVLMGDNWIYYFLEGYWSNGSSYFQIYESEDYTSENSGKINRFYNSYWNLPKYEVKHYRIIDEILYVGTYVTENIKKDWTKQYKFEYVNYNTIKIYNYKDEKTYTLKRK